MDQRENFIRLVKAKGFMTEEQLQTCMATWEQRKGEEPDLNPWDVALEQGFLLEKHRDRIDEHLSFIALREEDKRLGGDAVARGLIQASDLEVALIMQRKKHKDEKIIRRLEEILLDMGALQPDQIDVRLKIVDGQFIP